MKNKLSKKTTLIFVIIIISMTYILTSCVDFGYECKFEVIGNNGILVTEWAEEFPIFMMTGKSRMTHEIEFSAKPNEGYKEKEWKFNGEVVKDNKTNFFITPTIKCESGLIIVTVEFELK